MVMMELLWSARDIADFRAIRDRPSCLSLVLVPATRLDRGPTGLPRARRRGSTPSPSGQGPRPAHRRGRRPQRPPGRPLRRRLRHHREGHGSADSVGRSSRLALNWQAIVDSWGSAWVACRPSVADQCPHISEVCGCEPTPSGPSGAISGEQPEGSALRISERPEVTFVQGQDVTRVVEPRTDDDRSIRQTDAQRVASSHDVPSRGHIVMVERLRSIGFLCHLFEDGELGVESHACGQQVVELRKDERGERSGPGASRSASAAVVLSMPYKTPYVDSGAAQVEPVRQPARASVSYLIHRGPRNPRLEPRAQARHRASP